MGQLVCADAQIHQPLAGMKAGQIRGAHHQADASRRVPPTSSDMAAPVERPPWAEISLSRRATSSTHRHPGRAAVSDARPDMSRFSAFLAVWTAPPPLRRPQALAGALCRKPGSRAQTERRDANKILLEKQRPGEEYPALFSINSPRRSPRESSRMTEKCLLWGS